MNKKTNFLINFLEKIDKSNIALAISILTLITVLIAITLGYRIIWTQGEDQTVILFEKSDSKDPLDMKRVYFKAKILGFGQGLYAHRDNPKTSSLLTPLIYTDRDDYETSVIKNVDTSNKAALNGRPDKFDSQSYQAGLMKHKASNDFVCIEAYGIRLPEKSEFLNLISYTNFTKDENSQLSDNQICENLIRGKS